MQIEQSDEQMQFDPSDDIYSDHDLENFQEYEELFNENRERILEMIQDDSNEQLDNLFNLIEDDDENNENISMFSYQDKESEFLFEFTNLIITSNIPTTFTNDLLKLLKKNNFTICTIKLQYII